MGLSRRVNWRGGYAIAALVLTAPQSSVHAQQNAPGNMTVVGRFDNASGTAVLYIVTAKPTKDAPSKAAIVGIQYEKTDENLRFNGTYGRLNIAFLASTWPKFAAIWRKVRTARGDTKGDDFDGQTQIGVSTGLDGDIDFTMAGNGHDERYMPRDLYMFTLPVKDVAAFDDGVKAVSAYFAK